MLPSTITDQIRLWELERDRLQFSEGEGVRVWVRVREGVCVCKEVSLTVMVVQSNSNDSLGQLQYCSNLTL